MPDNIVGGMLAQACKCFSQRQRVRIAGRRSITLEAVLSSVRRSLIDSPAAPSSGMVAVVASDYINMTCDYTYCDAPRSIRQRLQACSPCCTDIAATLSQRDAMLAACPCDEVVFVRLKTRTNSAARQSMT